MTYSRKSFSGNAVVTNLTANITDTDLTIPVGATTGFPNTINGPFIVTLDKGSQTSEEKVEIASYTSTLLTVASGGRGADGTTAVPHTAGASLSHTLDAGTINNHETFVAGNGTVTPTASAIGDVAGNGTSSLPAAADHKHARESFAVGAVSASAPGDAENDGTSTSPARADHKHAREPIPAIQVPVGGIIEWASDSGVPANFLYLHGQTISGGAATYPALASLYPSWVSSGNLVLPDTRGKFVQGARFASDPTGPPLVGATGGSANVTLTGGTTGHIPQFANVSVSLSGNTGTESAGHDHTVPERTMVARSSNGTYTFGSGPDVNDMAENDAIVTSGQNANHTHDMSGVSGSVTFGAPSGTITPVPTIPPYIAFHKIVRAA